MIRPLRVGSQTKRQVIDITGQVNHRLPQGDGVAAIVAQHTTAAITTADLDPGTDLDFMDFIISLVPQRQWRHPHDPAHAPDHILASIIGTSVALPYQDGQLLLGTWQRVVLVELDGPRQRLVKIACLPLASQ